MCVYICGVYRKRTKSSLGRIVEFGVQRSLITKQRFAHNSRTDMIIMPISHIFVRELSDEVLGDN